VIGMISRFELMGALERSLARKDVDVVAAN